jgi:SanA protein
MRQKLVVVLLALAALALVIPIWMRTSVAPYTYASLYTIPRADVAVVLGASVAHGAPLPLLASRADAAIALYREGKVGKILVTGDNGALSHDEVTPVRKYLLAAGIPARDIFLDHAGFDTYSSMYRARDIFGARSVIIATQDFHLPRALWLARALGLTVYGVVAPGAEGSPLEYLREIPASLKALWDVTVHRTPKYLGPAIPLSGDGQATWY